MNRSIVRLSRLRLSADGRWVPSSLPLNRDRHPAPPRAPPPARLSESKPTFETLASDATPVPSIQSVEPDKDGSGTRTAVPAASATPAPEGPPAAGAASPIGALAKKDFLGVEIPLKPKAPEADECCMSGCATCVYDLYLEDLEHYHDALASARKLVVDKLRARRGLGTEAWRAAWPAELGPVDEALEDVDEGAAGKGGREKEEEARKRAEKELQRTREQLDPALRAFLEMEARMKAKQREREASSPPAAS